MLQIFTYSHICIDIRRCTFWWWCYDRWWW